MDSFQTKLIDWIRRGKDREALGPMRYRNVNGRAVPDDARYQAKKRLDTVLTPGQPKTETLRERQMRELGI
jgi:hypothetical protein